MEFKGKKGNGISITAKAVKESREPGAINKISVCLSDEPGVDLDERRAQISTFIQKTYSIEKKIFEKLKEYTGMIKNGTYLREFVVIDPVEGCSLSIKIRMQRYQKKEGKKSLVFYSSLFLPKIPVLTAQLIVLFEQRASELKKRKGLPRSEWQTLAELCKSWCIGINAFYSYKNRAKGHILHTPYTHKVMDLLDSFFFST